MGRKHFGAGALTAPLPAVLVSVGNMNESNILTIGWTGILSTHPARTYISVRPSRYSYKLLRDSGEFVIGLTSAKMARAVDYAGVYTGAKVDKISLLGLTKCESREVSAPTIAECPMSLECRVVEIIPMGSHDVFIADILSVSCDDSILDENGRICLDRADLLAYAHGEYFALGEKIGKFGFSTQKKSSKNPRAENKTSDKKPITKQEKAAKNEEGEKKRPFYLDAPRGKGRGGRPHGSKGKGGKR